MLQQEELVMEIFHIDKNRKKPKTHVSLKKLTKNSATVKLISFLFFLEK